MVRKQHNALKNNDIHVLHAFTYANETARLAATGFTADDVGKMAIDLDTRDFSLLQHHSPPVWLLIGSQSPWTSDIDPNGYVITDGTTSSINPTSRYLMDGSDIIAKWGNGYLEGLNTGDASHYPVAVIASDTVINPSTGANLPTPAYLTRNLDADGYNISNVGTLGTGDLTIGSSSFLFGGNTIHTPTTGDDGKVWTYDESGNQMILSTPSSGGGSDTPWTEDHDAAYHNLINLSALHFQSPVDSLDALALQASFADGNGSYGLTLSDVFNSDSVTLFPQVRVDGTPVQSGDVITYNGTVYYAAEPSGSQTPWTSNINAATYNLDQLGILYFYNSGIAADGISLVCVTDDNGNYGLRIDDVVHTNAMQLFPHFRSDGSGPVNGDVLTYNSTLGGMYAAAPSGGSSSIPGTLNEVLFSDGSGSAFSDDGIKYDSMAGVTLQDTSGVLSVDLTGRLLQDAFNLNSFSWQYRKAYMSDGSTVALDYSSTDNNSVYLRQFNFGYDSGASQNTMLTAYDMRIGSMMGDVSISGSTGTHIAGFKMPTSDGTNGQAIVTDGAGNLSFADAGGGSQSPWTQDILPAGYKIYDNGSPSVSIDPNTRELWGGGEVRVSWDNFQLKNSGTTMLDWNYLALYEFDGSVAIDWGAYGLWKSAVKKLDWNYGQTYDSTGSGSIDWEMRNLTNTSNNHTVAWEDCYLNDAGGALSVDWNNHKLWNGTSEYICWDGGLGFFGTSPISQPSSVSIPSTSTFGTSDDTTINDLITAVTTIHSQLQSLGLFGI